MSFHAYLFFSNTCKAAFTRYKEIFGGELFMMTNAEAPDGGMPGGPDLVITPRSPFPMAGCSWHRTTRPATPPGQRA